LYPDLFSIQNNQEGKKKIFLFQVYEQFFKNMFLLSYLPDVKNLSSIQDCHLILAKLMVLETFDEIQSCSLIELVNVKYYYS